MVYTKNNPQKYKTARFNTELPNQFDFCLMTFNHPYTDISKYSIDD